MRSLVRPALAGLAALALGGCGAHRGGHWSYSGAEGPAHWGALEPAFARCQSGVEQSPIDLAPATPGSAPALEPAYDTTDATVENNGHTVVITPGVHGGGLVVDGKPHPLLQLHFHHPSEHAIGGLHHELEIHLVHRGPMALAVVAIFVDEGPANDMLAPIFARLPRRGERRPAPTPLAVARLLPRSLASLRYRGSLTTPPCSEGVHWIVLREPITISRAQLAAFVALFPDDARPLQPRHGREVLAVP